MPNVIKSNYVYITDNNVKIIDSNKSDLFQPMHLKKAIELPNDGESCEGENLSEEEDLFQINHEMNGTEKFSKMKSMAEQLLQDATEEAEKMKVAAIQAAQQEIEQLRRDAIQQGYEEGLKQGRDEIDSKKQELENLKKQQEIDYEQRLEDMQENVTDLIIALVRKVTGVVIEEKSVINYLVKDSIKSQASCNEYRINVSKEDYISVLENVNEFKDMVKSTAVISICENPELSKNQCLIETDKNIIDCGITTKVDNLCMALKLLSVH